MTPQTTDRRSGPAGASDRRQVAQGVVLREWLGMEYRQSDTHRPPIQSLSERDVLDELLDRKPGAAAFVWRDAPVTWYETRLDPASFRRLRVIEGPEDLRWRDLSPDGTVVGAARRVASGDPDELAAETGVDVQKIRRFREEPPGGPLILSTRRGCVPRYVADGNHRAVALGLDLLADEFTPPRAYLGVGANPVLKPLLERACGIVGDVLR